MIADHLVGPVEMARMCLPGMKARGFGRVINMASTASITGYAFMTGYVAAKHAVLGFTRALALEVAKTGVTVNAICPGFTATDLVMGGLGARATKEGRSRDEVLAEFLASKPLGRLVQPEEIAATALWLASETAASVTGQAIVIDGGETIS